MNYYKVYYFLKGDSNGDVLNHYYSENELSSVESDESIEIVSIEPVSEHEYISFLRNSGFSNEAIKNIIQSS